MVNNGALLPGSVTLAVSLLCVSLKMLFLPPYLHHSALSQWKPPGTQAALFFFNTGAFVPLACPQCILNMHTRSHSRPCGTCCVSLIPRTNINNGTQPSLSPSLPPSPSLCAGRPAVHVCGSVILTEDRHNTNFLSARQRDKSPRWLLCKRPVFRPLLSDLPRRTLQLRLPPKVLEERAQLSLSLRFDKGPAIVPGRRTMPSLESRPRVLSRGQRPSHGPEVIWLCHK